MSNLITIEASKKSVEKLIVNCIREKQGNAEFILSYNSEEWTAAIGNPSQHVQMMEAGAEIEVKGSNAFEAVSNLLEAIRKVQNVGNL